MDAFKLDIIRATKKPYYRGVSAYLFNAQIQFGFDKSYKIIDVEFRKPFVFEGIQGLFFEKANLFQNTLQDTYDLLAQKGFELKKTDVGFAAEKLSISFFSDSFERSLDVPLDAVTVHF